MFENKESSWNSLVYLLVEKKSNLIEKRTVNINGQPSELVFRTLRPVFQFGKI